MWLINFGFLTSCKLMSVYIYNVSKNLIVSFLILESGISSEFLIYFMEIIL